MFKLRSPIVRANDSLTSRYYRWERQIPKDEDYWRQYVRKEEKDLIVRDSYPNLTRFPSIHRYPQTLYHGIRNDDNDDSNNIDDLARNDGKPFVESLTNFRSCRLSSFTKENDLVSIGEPVATFFPPTPSKRHTETFSTREEEYERVLAKDMSLRKGRSSPIPVNARYASSENAKVYKTYLKKYRSLHENDRPTGTCRNDGKSSTSRTKKTLLKGTNKNDLKSIGKLVDRIELSDYFDFNRESLTFDDTDDRFDLRSRITRNEDNGRIRYTSDLENKFECTTSNVHDAKHTERNKRSSSDGDFLKYSVRYAREALESLTKDLRPGLLRLGINETTKEVGPLETMDDTEKYEKKFLNISPVSLKPLSSRDRVAENEDYLPRTSLTEDFLNGLPKMSYFPRKKRDRCLSCLYKSLEEIVGVSTRKDAYERRKEREEGKYIGKYKENISVECESNGDVSFAEFKEERNQSDLGGAREEVGLTTKRNDSGSSDDSIAEENKFDLPSTQRENGEERTSVDEVKETEGRLPVPELESTGPDDKRITFKSISVSSDRSKCLVTSSSDEEDPPSVARVEEYSSTKSKYMPACHAPTILSHTLEPLRALKLRKSTGMRARMAFDETTDESPTLEPDEKSREIASRETTPMDTKRGTTEGDSKSIKKLIKVKSVSENLIGDADDAGDVNEAKEKSLFGRSFSCRNLEWILRDSTKGTTDLKSPGLRAPVPEDGPFRPLFSKEEIEETLKNFEERNASPTFALSTLCDMFLNRILESNDKSRDRRRDNIAKRLVKLLVESRRYSNPDRFPSDLIFSSKQRPLLNGQRLRRILPLDSYNLIAPLLGMPEHYPSLPVALRKIERPESTKERSDRSDLIEEIMDDLIVRTYLTNRFVSSNRKRERHYIGVSYD